MQSKRTGEQATKSCQTCNQVKPLEEFHKHPHTRDRRHLWCITCLRAYTRERYHSKKSDFDRLKSEVRRLRAHLCNNGIDPVTGKKR
jgi:hypothetical protein